MPPRTDSPAQQAIRLLRECSDRDITAADLRNCQRLLADQLEQQYNLGNVRATEAMDAELRNLDAPAGVLEGAGGPLPNPDPIATGYDVERGETQVVLEITRLLRERAATQTSQLQAARSLTVARVAVLVAAVSAIALVSRFVWLAKHQPRTVTPSPAASATP